MMDNNAAEFFRPDEDRSIVTAASVVCNDNVDHAHVFEGIYQLCESLIRSVSGNAYDISHKKRLLSGFIDQFNPAGICSARTLIIAYLA